MSINIQIIEQLRSYVHERHTQGIADITGKMNNSVDLPRILYVN